MHSIENILNLILIILLLGIFMEMLKTIFKSFGRKSDNQVSEGTIINNYGDNTTNNLSDTKEANNNKSETEKEKKEIESKEKAPVLDKIEQ